MYPTLWPSQLANCPHARRLLAGWQASDHASDPFWPDYEVALNAALVGQDPGRSLAARHAALIDGRDRLLNLRARGDAHLATRLTLIRIHLDLDERPPALHETQGLIRDLPWLAGGPISGARLDLDRPFLAPLPDRDCILENEAHAASWLHAMVYELLRNLSGTGTFPQNFPQPMRTRTLDLGCGAKPRNPFHADEVFGIDLFADPGLNIHRADLAVQPIPFDENTFDYVSAYDFIEHIPRIIHAPERINSFVDLMSEIYRVLKNSGIFLSVTPAYPQPAAFRDPTHVNIITEETFPLYFDHVNCWAAAYGFKGSFKIESQEWHGAYLVTVMRKYIRNRHE